MKPLKSWQIVTLLVAAVLFVSCVALAACDTRRGDQQQEQQQDDGEIDIDIDIKKPAVTKKPVPKATKRRY